MPRAEDVSPSEAARTLRDIDRITGRSRRVAYAAFTRAPLTFWGIAWLLGYSALDLLPWAVAIPVGVALALGAALGMWWWRPGEVGSGHERKVQLSWLVLMACSPLLVATAGVVTSTAVLLFLGALWGVALLLLAVATGDVALGVVGGLVVVAAAAVRIAVPQHLLLTFAVVAGGAMTALGAYRLGAFRTGGAR